MKIIIQKTYYCFIAIIIIIVMCSCNNRFKPSISNSYQKLGIALAVFNEIHNCLPENLKGEEYAIYELYRGTGEKDYPIRGVPIIRWDHELKKAEKMDFSYINKNSKIDPEDPILIVVSSDYINEAKLPSLYCLDSQFRFISFSQARSTLDIGNKSALPPTPRDLVGLRVKDVEKLFLQTFILDRVIDNILNLEKIKAENESVKNAVKQGHT